MNVSQILLVKHLLTVLYLVSVTAIFQTVCLAKETIQDLIYNQSTLLGTPNMIFVNNWQEIPTLFTSPYVLSGKVVLFSFQVAFLDISVDRIYEEWLYLEPMCVNASGQLRKPVVWKHNTHSCGAWVGQNEAFSSLGMYIPMSEDLCWRGYQIKVTPSYSWPLEHVMVQGFTTVHLCLSEYWPVLLIDMLYSILKYVVAKVITNADLKNKSALFVVPIRLHDSS